MTTLYYILLCQFVGLIGALATQRGLGQWYPQLRKPWFNPPQWLFGPVWTTLYLFMGIAAGLVHHDPLCRTLFLVQLALNALWSPLFFGLRRPDWALLNIALLWTSLAACVHFFQPVNPWAARLFWPYWVWVSFASLLNFELWRLNREQPVPSSQRYFSRTC